MNTSATYAAPTTPCGQSPTSTTHATQATEAVDVVDSTNTSGNQSSEIRVTNNTAPSATTDAVAVLPDVIVPAVDVDVVIQVGRRGPSEILRRETSVVRA